MAMGIFEQLAWLTKKVNQLCCIVKNGGSGSVQVDGATIKGDGTITSPLAITTALPVINMNVDLSGGDFNLSGAGIYRVTVFGSSFVFNDTGIVDGSRVIVTNSNLLSISFVGVTGFGVSVLYQGTQESVIRIPSGMTYEFIYNSAATTWYCLNPQPQPTYVLDIGGLVNPYDITTIGYYKLTNTGGGQIINLPDPAAFTGQEITIWNYDPTDVIGIGSNQPFGYSGSSIGAIPTISVLTVVSIGGQWVAKAFLP
jgi:hypothetical protein